MPWQRDASVVGVQPGPGVGPCGVRCLSVAWASVSRAFMTGHALAGRAVQFAAGPVVAAGCVEHGARTGRWAAGVDADIGSGPADVGAGGYQGCGFGHGWTAAESVDRAGPGRTEVSLLLSRTGPGLQTCGSASVREVLRPPDQACRRAHARDDRPPYGASFRARGDSPSRPGSGATHPPSAVNPDVSRPVPPCHRRPHPRARQHPAGRSLPGASCAPCRPQVNRRRIGETGAFPGMRSGPGSPRPGGLAGSVRRSGGLGGRFEVEKHDHHSRSPASPAESLSGSHPKGKDRAFDDRRGAGTIGSVALVPRAAVQCAMSTQRRGQHGSCATRGSRVQSLEPCGATLSRGAAKRFRWGLAGDSFAIVRFGSVMILVAVPGPG